MTNRRVAVALGGCGVYDGSEINEAVLTLLSLGRCGAQWRCFAPNIEQRDVIDHQNGEASNEKRNALREAARIARGEIDDLADLDMKKFDALIVPGGYGAAKNLCSYAVDGAEHSLQKDMAVAARAAVEAQAPIGLMCIAPVMAPLIFPDVKVRCTIGNDAETANAIEQMGGSHVERKVDEIEVDEQQRLVTTPAYMLATTPAQAYDGIDALVAKVLALAA